MRSSGVSLVLGILAALVPSAASAQGATPTFIQWSVTGTATASGRDEAILCSPSSEGGLTIHSMADWVFDFESPSKDPGTFAATIRIAAPESVAALHDNNWRTDDHLAGSARLVISSAGRGIANVPLLRVQFSADSLTSGTGARGKATGTVVCALM